MVTRRCNIAARLLRGRHVVWEVATRTLRCMCSRNLAGKRLCGLARDISDLSAVATSPSLSLSLSLCIYVYIFFSPSYSTSPFLSLSLLSESRPFIACIRSLRLLFDEGTSVTTAREYLGLFSIVDGPRDVTCVCIVHSD